MIQFRLAWFAATISVLAGILVGVSSASAQATISGVVKDTSGAVLPGVTVEASSPALIEKVRSVTTDANGQYSIVDLRSGTYAVAFTLPGFSTVKRAGLELAGTFTATVNADMRVGGLEETITVTGETPMVDVQSARRQQTMTREVIDAIPTGNRYQNLLSALPGVVVGGAQDVGGSRGDSPTDISVHGSNVSDGRIMIDGANVAPPAKGGGHDTMSVLDTVNSQEVVVSTSGGLGEAQTAGITINVIPREGGNRYSGQLFSAGTTGALQADNHTADLTARGLPNVNTVDKLWDVTGGFGGPLKRDKLWFYTTARYNGYQNHVAGMYVNKNAGNPNAWTFDPDLSQQATTEGVYRVGSFRTTWQASQRNKINFLWDEQYRCINCTGGGTAVQSIEATTKGAGSPNRTRQVIWRAPLTSRVLAELGTSSYMLREDNFRNDEVGLGLTRVTEQAGLIPGLSYRGHNSRSVSWLSIHNHGALSYVTGSHNMKVGATYSYMRQAVAFYSTGLNFRFRAGVPNQLTQFAYPYNPNTQFDVVGLYAQDVWTAGRLSLQWGVRYDQQATKFPASELPATLFTSASSYPAESPVHFKDVTPRAGLAYDVFGTGKTAFKVRVGKYVLAQDGTGSIYGTGVSKMGRIATTTSRTWTDANRDYVPDCSLRSPAANGECGAVANQLFGTDRVQTNYDPEILSGWGVRPYNWEFSTEVTHEILPRVAINLGYFRRWYGNFMVTDNLAVSPSDFSRFSVSASDPRLPGGGVTLNDLYDVNPAKFGQVNNLVTAASNYGKMTQRFDGVDLTATSRTSKDLTLQGGWSWGRTAVNLCDVASKLDNPGDLSNIVGFAGLSSAASLLSASQCKLSYGTVGDNAGNITGTTQLKALAAYTIPVVKVQVAGTFQSVNGPGVQARYVVPAALVAPSLGRPLAGGAPNVTVNLVEPGSMFGDRINKVDLRIAKVITLQGRRLQAGIDVFNAMNTSAVQTENPSFTPGGSWRVPTLIMDARLIRFSAQLNF